MEITKQYITDYLLPIVKSCGEELEGSIYTTHKTLNYNKRFIDKQKQIETIVKNLKGDKINILEIGFNAGFSAVLILNSNPNVVLHCIDINTHTYCIPCFLKIKEDFGDRIKMNIGDSTKLLTINNTDFGRFQLIHIDGGHTVKVARQDIDNSLKRLVENGYIIFDDYNFKYLKKLVDSYKINNISTNLLQAVFQKSLG